MAVVPEDERGTMRLDVNIAAGLRTARGKRLPVLLRNVSLYGFMAEGGATLIPGTTVVLDLFDGTAFESRIVWKRDGHVGGAFISPISDEKLAAIA